MTATNDTARGPLAHAIVDTLVHRIGKDEHAALPHDWLAATILTVRNEIIERWMDSTRAAHAAGAKRVYYLSLEFLIGRLLRDALANLARRDEVAEALAANEDVTVRVLSKVEALAKAVRAAKRSPVTA